MRIKSYELEGPLINGGGLVKNAQEAAMMARTGVGAVLAGSFTLLPRIGNGPNGETVYSYDEETGLMVNSVGMPNKGIGELTRSGELQTMIDIVHKMGKPFILNFAPVSNDPIDETEEFFSIIKQADVKGIDASELNAACPNVITPGGGRHELLSEHPQKMAKVIYEMGEIANHYDIGDIFVRIAPFREPSSAQVLASTLAKLPVKAAVAFNTFPGEIPLNEFGEKSLQVAGTSCGHSGKAMQEAAEKQTAWLVNARSNSSAEFEIIGSTGIHDAESIKRRLDLGAIAVSATTIFYTAQSSWAIEVDRIYEKYAELVG